VHRSVIIAIRCVISFLFWCIRPLVLGGQLAHRTLSGAHRTVRCPLPTVGATTCHAKIARPTVGAGDRWLTGQSGAPPDSLVNYSHVAPLLFSRATSSPRMTHRTVRCTTGQFGELYSYAAVESRERPFHADQPGAPDTVRCTTGQSGVPSRAGVGCTEPSLFLILFSLFLALRQNTLVLKTMY
jgi:hypothetical protein